MPSKFCRGPGATPLKDSGHYTTHTNTVDNPNVEPSPNRTEMLNVLQVLINRGMCASAAYLAREHKVQFNPVTLRSWANSNRTDGQYRHRRTYVALVHETTPIAVPLPAPTPITTPPAISLARPKYRRFVRSRVA
jgi:hypothetical protein